MKKKILLTLLTLSTVASLTACTSNTETTEEVSEVVSEEISENITSEDITSEEVVENSTEIIEENTESIENNEEIIENNNPATDMVTKIKENYTQTYRCNMPIETDTMTNVFGITEDMYEYYYGELPMISNHADMILVVKPTEEKYDEVKTKLEEYKNYQINQNLAGQWVRNLHCRRCGKRFAAQCNSERLRYCHFGISRRNMQVPRSPQYHDYRQKIPLGALPNGAGDYRNKHFSGKSDFRKAGQSQK